MVNTTDDATARNLKRELQIEVRELKDLIHQERWNTALGVAGYITERLRPYASDEKSKA